tara:strand:+ start:111 stop:260 length:150 start_codon:yes stop_codon:yes gene_type:complete
MSKFFNELSDGFSNLVMEEIEIACAGNDAASLPVVNTVGAVTNFLLKLV